MEIISKFKNPDWYSINDDFILSMSKHEDVSDGLVGKMRLFDSSLNKLFETEFPHDPSSIFNNQNHFYFAQNESKYVRFDPFTLGFCCIYDGSHGHVGSRIEDMFIVEDKSKWEKTNTPQNPSIKTFYKYDGPVWETKSFGSLILFKERLFLLYDDPNEKNVDRSQNQFSKLDPTSGEIQWSFNLKEIVNHLNSKYPFDYPHKIKNPIGQYRNQLWFAMDNAGMLCLDINTGMFLHFIRDLDMYTDTSGVSRAKYPVLPWPEKAVILNDEGKMVCLHTWYYWEIDLNSLKIEFSYLRPYFTSEECYIYNQRKPLIIEGSNIISVSERMSTVFSFNRNTKSYDWTFNLPKDCGTSWGIEKHGTKLYVDTNSKMLVVIET